MSRCRRLPALPLCLGLSFSITLAALAPPAPGQGTAADVEAAEAALTKKAIQILLRYAGTARSKKFGQQEKAAYQLILDEYDPDHPRARRSLDYTKEKDGWKLLPPKKRRDWEDKANRKGRFEVQQAERKAWLALAKEHRQLGKQMLAAGAKYAERGQAHLQRAILFDPLDREAHEALGHQPCAVGDITYHGTAEQVAFIRRMKEIETFALTLAKKTYDPQPVTTIPAELQKTGLQFFGARTRHFTVFVRGTQENADDVVQWGERALDFLDFVVGDKQDRVKKRARRYMANWGWIGIVWTQPEMDKFMKANPSLVPKRQGRYMNLNFRSGAGKQARVCEVARINMPSYMHDFLIAHVFHYGLGQQNNVGLLEGVHHAATWFLKSTCFSKFGAEPKGTVTNRRRVLPEGANWWLREMRNQAIARTDTPLNVVPRTELYKFHSDIRLKTWSFAVWAMARFPERWFDFLSGFPHGKIPFPDDVDKIGAKVFGMPLDQVEAEWRIWASGRGVTAAATGYGPPLLPEFPNKDELEGLERLNAVRAAVTCWSEPAPQGSKPAALEVAGGPRGGPGQGGLHAAGHARRPALGDRVEHRQHGCVEGHRPVDRHGLSPLPAARVQHQAVRDRLR
jgi:hypothetical protein